MEDVEFHFDLLSEVNLMTDSLSTLPRPVEFESVPHRIFAEQLTYMDAVSTFALCLFVLQMFGAALF